jgi:hypothetical protein
MSRHLATRSGHSAGFPLLPFLLFFASFASTPLGLQPEQREKVTRPVRNAHAISASSLDILHA